MSNGIVARKGEIRYDTVLVVFVDNAKRRSAKVEKGLKIIGIEASGVSACRNFFGNVGTDRNRIVCSGRVVGRHVRRQERFIVAEFEAITDSDRDIIEVLKDTSVLEIIFPLRPA